MASTKEVLSYTVDVAPIVITLVQTITDNNN
jgi:hypothetical protein